MINVFLCFRLEENKLRHDEDVISIAKCRFEIKNMKEEMIQLHDANMYDPVFCFMTFSYYITSKWFHTFICVAVSQNQCRYVQKNSGGTGRSVGQTQDEQVCSTSYFNLLWYIFFRELNCKMYLRNKMVHNNKKNKINVYTPNKHSTENTKNKQFILNKASL